MIFQTFLKTNIIQNLKIKLSTNRSLKQNTANFELVTYGGPHLWNNLVSDVLLDQTFNTFFS